MRHATPCCLVGALLLSPLLIASISLAAEPAPTTAPAPAAVAADGWPDGPAAAGPADVTGTVLVLPFVNLRPAEVDAWVGRFVQQNLVSNLARVAPEQVAPGDAPARAAEEARAAGAKAGARFVVFGSYLLTPARAIRFTGQILDVPTGQPVAGLRATGVIREIFALQDTLVAQIQDRLFPAASEAEAAAPSPSLPIVPFAYRADDSASVPSAGAGDAGACVPAAAAYPVYPYIACPPVYPVYPGSFIVGGFGGVSRNPRFGYRPGGTVLGAHGVGVHGGVVGGRR